MMAKPTYWVHVAAIISKAEKAHQDARKKLDKSSDTTPRTFGGGRPPRRGRR